MQRERREWEKGNKAMDSLGFHMVDMHQVDTGMGENIILGSIHHCRWPVEKKERPCLMQLFSKGLFLYEGENLKGLNYLHFLFVELSLTLLSRFRKLEIQILEFKVKFSIVIRQ